MRSTRSLPQAGSRSKYGGTNVEPVESGNNPATASVYCRASTSKPLPRERTHEQCQSFPDRACGCRGRDVCRRGNQHCGRCRRSQGEMRGRQQLQGHVELCLGGELLQRSERLRRPWLARNDQGGLRRCQGENGEGEGRQILTEFGPRCIRPWGSASACVPSTTKRCPVSARGSIG